MTASVPFPDTRYLLQIQKDLWAWPRARTAVMVGAGFSRNAEPKRGIAKKFPSWNELTRTMFDELHPFEGSQERAEILQRKFDQSNPLRIASEYEAAFGSDLLEILLRTEIPDNNYDPGMLHQKLLKLPWTDVFTTNYDTLLERTDVLERAYTTVACPSLLRTASSPRIVKLHGCFNAKSTLVITEEHFRKYPRDCAPFVNTVQQSLLENSFVLVGFSGDDPNFLQWTGWIRDVLGDKYARVYLVAPMSLTDPARKLLAMRGVTPVDLSPLFKNAVPSKGIHAASIEWFLDSLAAAKPAKPEDWPNI